MIVILKEQEEEMNCREGAEGGSKSQRHQSESIMVHDFLSDNTLEEIPGPKFKSLRHLRQVFLDTKLNHI